MKVAAAAGGSKSNAQMPLSLHGPRWPPHLPCDILEEILCRLPVKHLLPLYRVCKSWNSLIFHDSKFAKKHLRFSTFSHDHHHLAMHNSLEFLLWKSPISSFFISDVPADHFTQLRHPLINQEDGYDRFSTCDGMICFTVDESLALLCNPSIRKFNSLPRLKTSYFTTTYTLVYDRFIDNYKIIALSICCNDKNKKEVHVYTLGSDDWRKIQDFPYHYFLRIDLLEEGIFVSDTVNWLVHDTCSSSRVIVSLDLEKESYQQLLQPLADESSLSFPTYNYLGALRDCLCIFSHSAEFFDIWMMKEYRNEKSWIKLLKVPYIGDPHCYMDTVPLYIYDDGRVLTKFVKMNQFILAVYDSKNNTFKIHEIQNNIHVGAIPKIYVDSLISPFPRY